MKPLTYLILCQPLHFIFFLGMKQLEESNFLKAINVISESLRLYTLVLNQKNPNITKCEDSLAKCFALAGKIIIYYYIKKIMIIKMYVH